MRSSTGIHTVSECEMSISMERPTPDHEEERRLNAAQFAALQHICVRLAILNHPDHLPSLGELTTINDVIATLQAVAETDKNEKQPGSPGQNGSNEPHSGQQVRQALEHVEHLKNRFIRNMSHEFRTPLASIDGFAKALLRLEAVDGLRPGESHPELASPDARRQFLTIISQEAQRLGKLIEDVLDMSEVESKRWPYEPTLFSAQNLFSEALTLFDAPSSDPNSSGEQIAVQNIVTRFNPEPDGPMIYADRQALLEILRQLLVNAQKFSFGKEVVLGAEFVSISPVENSPAADSGHSRRISTNARLYVKDRGIGIAREELDRIFDRFYRVDKATSAPGTGLGLAIVRALTTQNNGHVWADSTLGRGSTFYVLLPNQPPGS